MKIFSEQNKINLLSQPGVNSQNILLSLNLDTTVDGKKNITSEPIHYAFLLDISDSSQGHSTKLDKIKIVLNSFVENTLPLFREEDKISIVLYDQGQYLLFDGLTKFDKEKISSKIDYLICKLGERLQCDNLKNKYNNITHALKQTREKVLKKHGYNKNKIVVISDTKPSFCMDDFGRIVDKEEDVLEEATIIASQNIALDCICLENEIEEEQEQGDYNFAQKLVQSTNGKAYIIENISEIKTNLSYIIKDSHESSRYNAKLTLQFNKGVDVGDYYSMSHGNKYFGKMNIQEANAEYPTRYFIIELPELKDNTIHNFILDVNVPTVITEEERSNPNYKDPKAYNVVFTKVEYDTMVDGKLTKQQQLHMVNINVTEDIILAQQGRKGKIETQYKMVTIKKLEGDFIRANADGDYNQLLKLGREMSNLYLELGKYRESNEVKKYFTKAVSGKKLKTSEINNMVKTSSTTRISDVPEIEHNPFEDMVKNN